MARRRKQVAPAEEKAPVKDLPEWAASIEPAPKPAEPKPPEPVKPPPQVTRHRVLQDCRFRRQGMTFDLRKDTVVDSRGYSIAELVRQGVPLVAVE